MLFPSERSGTATSFVLSHDIAEILASGALAVSLEPLGGSKTGRPSGPVLDFQVDAAYRAACPRSLIKGRGRRPHVS